MAAGSYPRRNVLSVTPRRRSYTQLAHNTRRTASEWPGTRDPSTCTKPGSYSSWTRVSGIWHFTMTGETTSKFLTTQLSLVSLVWRRLLWFKMYCGQNCLLSPHQECGFCLLIVKSNQLLLAPTSGQLAHSTTTYPRKDIEISDWEGQNWLARFRIDYLPLLIKIYLMSEMICFGKKTNLQKLQYCLFFLIFYFYLRVNYGVPSELSWQRRLSLWNMSLFPRVPRAWLL